MTSVWAILQKNYSYVNGKALNYLKKKKEETFCYFIRSVRLCLCFYMLPSVQYSYNVVYLEGAVFGVNSPEMNLT